MEDRRRKSQLNFITIGAFKYPILPIIASPIVADFSVCCVQIFYTNYQRDRHSVAIFLGSNLI